MKITSLKVNHLVNPLGFQMDKTVFSWKVSEAEGKKQTQARVKVALNVDMKNICADTGWQETLNSLGARVDVKLTPCTRYYWTVSVRSDAGEEAVSEVSWFETARMDENWNAKWIGCADDKRHPIFSKEIPACADAVSARLYICGLGLYEARFDGKKIGDEVLTPYCNAYDKWVQYQTYDVTNEIQAGGTLSVALGDGWYKGRFGFNDRTGKGYYGDSWKLIAEIRIVKADGSVACVGTDESWQKTENTITHSNIYDGEYRDDTLPKAAPVPATLVDAPAGTLTARYSLPVRNQMEIIAKTLIRTPAGEEVIDLEQEITGGFRLHIHEPKGKRIYLQFGEILQNDNFYRDNLRSAKAEYEYISNGEPIDLEPTFTFYGYRYVKVEGVTNLKAEDFTGLCQWSDMEKTGKLSTGAPLVNRLIANTEWGHLDNFLDVPTDCPQRDERMGWTGDAEVFAPTACLQREAYAFYRKYLHDMAFEQEKLGGAVPNVVPAFGHAKSACAWGDAATIIPWHVYSFYGDKTILEEQFESMRSWVDFITAQEEDNHSWRTRFHFGDWLALDNFQDSESCVGGTDTGFLASVYYLESVELTAKAARVIGKANEAEKYEVLSEKIRAEINEEYYSPSGRCCIDTQTAHLLTMRHQLGNHPERSADALVRLLNANKGKLRTGFIGTPILCEALSGIGRSDLAYNLLLNEEYPGWLYEVKLGATTIWERWNSVLADGSISSTGMNSLNHYSYGAIVRWIYERAAGLKQDLSVPGFRHASFAPEIDARLGHIDLICDSPAGKWQSGWKVNEDGTCEIHLSIPFGCTADVKLPGSGEEESALESGEYCWTIAMHK